MAQNTTNIEINVTDLAKMLINFLDDAKKTTNKAAAARARKLSLKIAQSMKDYRKISIK